MGRCLSARASTARIENERIRSCQTAAARNAIKRWKSTMAKLAPTSNAAHAMWLRKQKKRKKPSTSARRKNSSRSTHRRKTSAPVSETFSNKHLKKVNNSECRAGAGPLLHYRDSLSGFIVMNNSRISSPTIKKLRTL
jgi:hypothetical protein